MYYQFDSRLNMPAILFDDDRLVVGKKEYDYNDLEEITITKSPFLSTYGIIELTTREGKKVPVPFVKGDLHRVRTAVQELAHLLKVRRAAEAAEAAAVCAEYREAAAVMAGSPDRETAEKPAPAEAAGKTAEVPETDESISAGRTAWSGGGQASMDPYEEMKKLKELLDLEIVTQEEFDRKKRQLLGL